MGSLTESDGRVKFGRLESGEMAADESDAHIITIAPTGAGKNRTSLAWNLLTWPGSVWVNDPKGENAKLTAPQRRRMGQQVYILDPFGVTGQTAARYNPLDFMSLGEDGITQADRLADTLILKDSGGENRFWTDEARALLKAILLHVKSFPAYEGARNLGSVNTMASYPVALVGKGEQDGEMQENAAYEGLVKRIANRMKAKSEREGPAVWSTLQSNLGQFLDDPRMARSLSETSMGLDFERMKLGNMSIYAVLPVQFLETFNRWLRLLVGSALDRLLREMIKPPIPVLMVLDEFAHLGYLEAVQTAYGLARGAGVKMWVLLQSLAQLDAHYEESGRENFIANAGAIEVFNLNENTGCQYFAEMMGGEYLDIESFSRGWTNLRKEGGRPTLETGSSVSEEYRPLMMSRDVATLNPDYKILIPRNRKARIIRKVLYDQEAGLKELAKP